MPSGTKRTRSPLRSSSAEASETAPTFCQLAPPLVLYCQVPVPEVRPVRAMPCTAPVSASVTWPVRKLDTATPGLLVSESVRPVSVGPAGVSTGASLTLLTVSVACAVPLEYAALPPLVLVSAVLRVPLVDAAPALWSQARKVRPAALPLAPSGTKRNWVVLDSSNAALSETAPTPVQVTPSVEYCQVPPPLLLVMAMPLAGPSTSAWVVLPSRVETVMADEMVSSL